MKKILLFVLLLILTVAVSCTQNEPEIDIINGTYTGYFSRISPSVDYRPSTVSLTFTGNKFTGSSSIEKYPAICQGSYSIAGDEIAFSNACPWTAEFDWTYILDGDFEYAMEGDELTLTRRYNENMYDIYTLVKEK